jgi:glyoxylate reductase
LQKKFYIFVTREIPGQGLDRLRAYATVNVFSGQSAPSHQQILQNVQNCDGLLTMLSDKITPAVIDAASPHLKIISNYAVGYNNIDVEYATQRSIIVTNTPDVLTDSTADLTWALILASARRLIEADQITRSKQWARWTPGFMLGTDVHHKTLGLIGLGRIGLAVAKRALAFNMKVLYYSRTRRSELESQFQIEYRSFNNLLSESDFISIHVPLTPETQDMIGATQFSLMKSTAILINTSRGSVIDEKALIYALKKSQIKGAGLDVYNEEPTRNTELLKLNNVVLTPHIGSATYETRIKMADLAVDNLIYGLTQEYEKIKIVNPAVLK